MERQQRYCVQCAARRADVSNPASRYFAAASRQRRRPPRRAPRAAASPDGASQTRAAAVFFFALLPIAVAIGVLVGRSGSGADDEALLAALRDGNAAGVVAGARGAGRATRLERAAGERLLARQGVHGEARRAADRRHRRGRRGRGEGGGRGRGGGGRRDHQPGRLRDRPRPGPGRATSSTRASSKDRGEAEKALGKLKEDFPDAEVVAVESRPPPAVSRGRKGGDDEPEQGGRGDRVTGRVHEVTTEPPSEEQVAARHRDRQRDRQPDRRGLHRPPADAAGRDRRRRRSRGRAAAADRSRRLMLARIKSASARPGTSARRRCARARGPAPA